MHTKSCTKGTVDRHWQASKKRCSLFKLLLVKHHLAWGWSLSLHYRWCRRPFKETSAVHLRRPVRTPPFRRRGLRLREQASQFDSRSSKATFFPSWYDIVETQKKSQNSFGQSWADAVTVLRSVQEDVTAPFRLHGSKVLIVRSHKKKKKNVIDVGLLRTGCVIRGVG